MNLGEEFPTESMVSAGVNQERSSAAQRHSHVPRRDLHIMSKFHIPDQIERLGHSHVTVTLERHVRDRLARQQVSCYESARATPVAPGRSISNRPI